MKDRGERFNFRSIWILFRPNYIQADLAKMLFEEAFIKSEKVIRMVELTPKQKKFCEIYAMDPCGERAAIAAGYESKSARQQASRLLTNENIIIYIRELQETMSSARILTATETRMFWSDIIKDEKQKMSDRLQASLLLAKSGGLFRTSVEMNLHHEEKPSTLICLPAIPGEDPPRRGKNTWIYGEDEAELVHNYPNGRESK